MKKRLSHIVNPQHILAAFLSLFLFAAVSSCSDDDHLEAGRATVKMTFTTRASAQADGVSTLAERERMQTLRVIMENANTGKILYNVFYDNLKDVTSKTITFQDVPVEEKGTPFNFYAVANEKSFLGTGESLEGKSVDLGALYSRAIGIDFNSETNKDLAIPQAKKNQKLIKPEKGTQFHTVQLEFPVAKVNVNFSNRIEEKQTVSDIKILGLTVTDGKLFPQDFSQEGTEESVPEAGTDAGNISFIPNPLEVSAGTFGGASGSASVTPMYIYPAKGNAYTLAAVWNGNKTVDLNSGGQLSEGIRRGRQLNIGITLKYGVMELSGLSVTVDDWTSATPITPDFQ